LPANDAPSQYPIYTVVQPQKSGLIVQLSDRRPENVAMLGGHFFEDPEVPLLLFTQSSSS